MVGRSSLAVVCTSPSREADGSVLPRPPPRPARPGAPLLRQVQRRGRLLCPTSSLSRFRHGRPSMEMSRAALFTCDLGSPLRRPHRSLVSSFAPRPTPFFSSCRASAQFSASPSFCCRSRGCCPSVHRVALSFPRPRSSRPCFPSCLPTFDPVIPATSLPPSPRHSLCFLFIEQELCLSRTPEDRAAALVLESVD